MKYVVTIRYFDSSLILKFLLTIKRFFTECFPHQISYRRLNNFSEKRKCFVNPKISVAEDGTNMLKQGMPVLPMRYSLFEL